MTRRESIFQVLNLTGLTLSGSLISFLVSGCQTKDNTGFPFDTEQNLVKLIDLIIVPGTVPGAGEAGVLSTVKALILNCYDDSSRIGMYQTLENLQLLDSNHPEDRLRQVEAEVYNDDGSTTWPYYSVLKGLVLAAYFTSEPVMKILLDYHPIPGRFEGCTELSAISRVYEDNNV